MGPVSVTSLSFWLLSDLSFACVITVDQFSSLIPVPVLSVAKVFLFKLKHFFRSFRYNNVP